MGLITLFLIAFGLSMDAFAVSISNSMCFAELSKKQAIASSFTFGVFQGAMPVLGFLAGRGFAGVVTKIDHWLALILLGIIGGKMLMEGLKHLREGEQCMVGARFSVKLMLTQGVATSIDALAIGVSFAALKVNIFAAALTIALITFVCCCVGHFIGKKAGGALGNRAEIFGGIILVGIGLKIFIEHMFF